ncbi:Uncharacterised protein [Mycobacteroides abscessus subsp. abscessus]|nr:Uncharacterised protein [Mycobacteroides abscessus subsp. abscessus]
MPRPATWTRPPRPFAEKERRERYQGRGSAGGRCTGAATALLAFVAAVLPVVLVLLAGVSSWAGCCGAACGVAVSGAMSLAVSAAVSVGSAVSVVSAAGVASASSVVTRGVEDTRVSCRSCEPSSASVSVVSSVVGASASWVAPLRISSNDERALRGAGASSEVWAGVEAARSAPVRAASAVTSASSWLSEPCRFSRGSFDMPPLFQDRAPCVAVARGSGWGGPAEKSLRMWLASLESERYAVFTIESQ